MSVGGGSGVRGLSARKSEQYMQRHGGKARKVQDLWPIESSIVPDGLSVKC